MILDLKSCDLNETCPIIKVILEDEELYHENLVEILCKFIKKFF